MTNIRINVGKSKVIPYTYEGENLHYIEIDTRDYGLDQLTVGTHNKIWAWARKYHISVNAWDELDELMDDIQQDY